MLGLSFIKNLIVDNSSIINKDVEKGLNEELLIKTNDIIKTNLQYSNLHIITTDPTIYNDHKSDVFINIL